MVSRRVHVLPALAVFAFAAAPTGAEPPPRPPQWAVRMERPGLPNLHRVSDGLYRGAQPSASGLRALRELGVKTVVNLRNHHHDPIEGAGLAYEEIPMDAWGVTAEHVVRFLRIATDPARQPVFVHCQHGADRTGTLVAAYRMAVLGWSAEEAIREMREGGFGYHSIWRGLLKLLRGLDVALLRQRAGITGPGAPATRPAN